MKKLSKAVMLGFALLSAGAVIHASEADDVVQDEVAVVTDTAAINVVPEVEIAENSVPTEQVQAAAEGYVGFNWWLPILALILTIGLLYLARDAARKYTKKQKMYEKEVREGNKTRKEHLKPEVSHVEHEVGSGYEKNKNNE